MAYRRISLLEASAKILLSLATAAPAGAVIVGVGNTCVVLARLPEAIWHTYGALWRTPRLGPVAKTTIGLAALPVEIVALPPVALLASTIFGLGYGFWKGFYIKDGDDSFLMGPVNGIVDSAKLVYDFNKAASSPFDWLRKVSTKPLKEGEKPFEIRIVDGLRGLASVALAAPFEALGLTAVVLRHWPRMVLETYRVIWRWPNGLIELTFSIALSALAAPIAALIVPLTPVATLAFGTYDTCTEGYQTGIRSAFKNALTRIADLHKLIKDVRKKNKEK
jgi:hypothetical protein